MANYGYQGSQYGGAAAPPYGHPAPPPADYNHSYYPQQQHHQSPPPPGPAQHQQPQYQNYQYQHQPSQQPPTPQQLQQPYQPPLNVAAPEPFHARPHMQDDLANGLARLDMNARPAPQHHHPSPYTSTSSPTSAYTPHPGVEYSPAHGFDSPSARPSPLNVGPPPAQYPVSAPTPQQQLPPPQQQQQQQPQPPRSQTPAAPIDTNFPGLPKLPYRTANIPESDEERGARLDRDRLAILGSSNFEDQLGWAQDALNWVDAAAEQNARLVLLGQGRASVPPMETQLRTDAVNVTEHMASQRHPRATFMKGMWLEFGKFGHAEDKRDAFEHFSRAARAGYARAEYRIGMQFEATGSPSQAMQHYRAGEQAGDAASCYRMGMICALGQLSQPQDYARAVTLIRHAAEHADDNAPQGAYVYGMLLSNDLPQIKIPEQFLQTDLDAGKRYIEKSAWLGFSKAQLKMASAYEVASLHCEVNPALSMHYSALAARQGEPEAEMALSKWFVVGSDGVFPKNERLAYMYAERAAGTGLPIAYFAMGYFNEVGAGVTANVETARGWYQKAAGEGNREAADALARLSNNQQLSMRDHEDVAVARIKSTHGSKRGGPRPPRLQQRVAAASSLPTVPDESGPQYYPQAASYTRPLGATPPPPQTHQPPQPHQQQYQQQGGPPPRASSAVPYPLDDARPVSAAPYPGADPRPSMPSLPPQQQHDPYAQGQQQPAYPPQPRPYSTPASQPQAATSYPRPPPSPQPNAYGPPPAAHPPPVRAHPQSQARPPSQPQQQPRPPQQQQQQRVPSGPGPARPPKEPAPTQASAYAGPVPSSRPPPPSSTPSLPNVGGSGGARPPSARPPAAAPSGGSRPSSAAPSAASTPRPQYAAPGAGAGPGKARPAQGHGPKTFDQMGVPAAKNESECVLM